MIQHRTILSPTSARIVAWVFLAVLVLSAYPAHAQTGLREVANKLVKDMVADPDAAKLQGEKLLVAEFGNINGKGDAVPRILQEMLTTAFVKDKHFRVVERAQLEKALTELKISSSGLIDPDNAKKIGKMLGAAYMVVGSISEIGGNVSIDARIVAIESGESVTAADATLGDNSTSAPSAQTSGAGPTIDLSQTSNTNSAGQMVGSAENFGLLGGTKFRIAWRENLGSTPICAFAVGDVTGDGFPRLVGCEDNTTTWESRLVVSKWADGRFKRTWSDGEGCGDPRDRNIGNGPITLLVMRLPDASVRIMAHYPSRSSRDLALWRWDGTTYARKDQESFGRLTYSVPESSRVVAWYGLGVEKEVIIGTLTVKADGTLAWGDDRKDTGVQPFTPYDERSDCVAADLDADGKPEIAVSVIFDNYSGDQPIQIFAIGGERKFMTESGYGYGLSVWQPGGLKTPYLVARKNSKDENKKPNGGYIYFLQWNGETYEEIWKSNKLDDKVVDVKVCDPKGEGKMGLVVLTSDKKGMYLTKIVSD